MIEPLLLTAAAIGTFDNDRALTNASGFYFERAGKLFLVTSRHVVFDEDSHHFPTRLEIELHLGLDNVAQSTGFSIPLYRGGRGVWREAVDSSGKVDVAAIEIDRDALPDNAAYRAFTPRHIGRESDHVEAGTSLLVVGFPLGFHDTLHHMPVVRHAVIASSFGLRFQGEGYFLTDGRTHRGSSGSPVVARAPAPTPAYGDLPWMLLGIHSARIDIGTRDTSLDEALGLNSAWYADVLMPLTET
jgi:S1-C subfamily serine protease